MASIDNGLVVVTGGGAGLGLAIVDAMAAHGWRLLICGRDGERLAQVADRWSNVSAIRLDLAHPAAVERFARAALAAGPVVGLINNAAGQQDVRLADQSFEDIDREVRANLTAPAILVARLAPSIAGKGGFVVNIGSGLGVAPKSSAAVYCATKAALRNLSLGLRNQFRGGQGLRVVDVTLPLVDTSMTKGRGRGKIAPEVAAARIVAALERGPLDLYVGKAALLPLLQRLSPALVRALLRGARTDGVVRVS